MKFFVNARNRDGLLVLLAALLVLLYVVAGGGHFALDDGWIHQTFARNLAQHGEWAFIPGQATAASTSPLYTVLLSIGYRLSVPYVFWTHFLGFLALAGTAFIGARLAANIVPDEKLAPLITGLALLFTWHHIWAAASGMETMLFGMLTLLLIYLAIRPVSDVNDVTRTQQHTSSSPSLQKMIGDVNLSSAVIFGICAALTTLARPEGIVLVAIIGGLLLLTRQQGTFVKTLLWGVIAGIVFVIVMTPYLLLNLELTGGILPNTAEAKFVQFGVWLQLPLTARLQNLMVPIFVGGQIMLVPGMLMYGVMVIRQKTLSDRMMLMLPFLWAGALLLVYALRLPAGYQHGRYVMPALPALVTAGTIGTVLLLRWGQNRRNISAGMAMLRRVFSRSLALMTIGVYLIFALVSGVQVYQRDVAIINEEMVASAHWIAENLPEDDLLAIHDIGAVGYFAPRPALLDIAGLVSPEVIPIVADDPALWALLEDRDARYLMGFPDQLPGQSPDDPRLCPLFITNGQTSKSVGGPNMAIYRLAWDEDCG